MRGDVEQDAVTTESVADALACAHNVLAQLISPQPGASTAIVYAQAVEAEAKTRRVLALLRGERGGRNAG